MVLVVGAISNRPELPTIEQRLEARNPPKVSPVMYQQWRSLLFLHWEWSIEEIQATLPDGLFVDTFLGKAYLGIVPFFMQNIRPRFLPALPSISNFMEMNLRTYVYDKKGVPGIWFFSLEANQKLAVLLARRFFHLPYQYARMSSSLTVAGAIDYRSNRRGTNMDHLQCLFEYVADRDLISPSENSLEFFLIERYRLYVAPLGRLFQGSVFHPPYPLCEVKLTKWNDNLLVLNQFAPSNRPPDHVIMSRGVDVKVYPLTRT